MREMKLRSLNFACKKFWVAILALFFLGLNVQPGYSQENESQKILALIDEGKEFSKQGRHSEAIRLFEEALSMGEKALGQEDLLVIIILDNLASQYKSISDYSRAELLFQRSLTIREKVFGQSHHNVAIGLDSLALLYYDLHDYSKAASLFKRSLEIREKELDLDPQDVAARLNIIALLYQNLGEYSKAEALYKRALAIQEKALGSDHPDVATSLNNLAMLYQKLGDYSKAEPLCKRSLVIREKALGPDHSNVATSLSNLAVLYQTTGDYSKAETLYMRSLAIQEKALGPNHNNVGKILNNLAVVYQALGDYSKAEALFERALTIREKALGPDHPDIAQTLSNLAELYRIQRNYAKAVPVNIRSLAIYEKTLGPNHPDFARVLDNFALLLLIVGDYSKAENLYKKSLEIRKKVLGPEHPDVARSLNNLAVLCHTTPNCSKEEHLFRKSLAIMQKTFGLDHPDVSLMLNNMAVVYAYEGAFSKSGDIFVQALNIDNKLIDQTMGFTSEEQKIKFLAMKRPALNAFLSLVNQHLIYTPSMRKDALNVWLKRKGVILEVQKRFQEALFYTDDPETLETFYALSKVRTQLSRLTFAQPDEKNLNTYRKRIDDLKRQKEKLEAKLSRLNQAFALNRKIARADCEKLSNALPANSVLIEFARVKMFDFKRRKGKVWKPAHYLAFVLHAGNGGNVGMIDLGDAKEIDQAVSELRKGISSMQEKVEVSSTKVYNLVFEPLKKEIGDKKEIFISPDGNLNLIPFEVLQGPDGRYLIEDYTFNYLAAGRDLLGFEQPKEKQAGKALLIGDPDFDMTMEEKEPVLEKLAQTRVKRKEIPRRSMDMGGFRFKRLPGTKKEVESIKSLLGKENTFLYTGKEALEEVLKKHKVPRIVHLATHGFFLKDQDSWEISPKMPGRAVYSFTMPKPRTKKKIKVENPMLRSGFALAGANRAGELANVPADDGIVTSEEILGLRLRGTEMIVLSACDTGLGEVKAGEGVFGLRRAFAQAGARSLIMSLWQVPDRETSELMEEFYRNVLKRKMNRCQALRQAALKQMKIAKDRYGYPYPLCWGGFVMVGDPGKPSAGQNIQ
ncbi:MAG: CHAT domain-containing protein [Desulfobacteraceae bacterium]|nr:CHAT domain-containing protein [Desulfobacteraceae bacterium]